MPLYQDSPMGRSIDCKLETLDEDGDPDYDLVYSIPLGAPSLFSDISEKYGIGELSQELDEDGDWICDVLALKQDDVAKIAALLGELRGIEQMLGAIHKYCRKHPERDRYVLES